MTSRRPAGAITNGGGRFWALGSESLPITKALKIMQKHLLDTQNLRRVPAQFSWVDHRLIRERRLSGVPVCGWALYLFLVTVGDEQGLSYYSDSSICGHLSITSAELGQARQSLLTAALIAWEAPLYQVLQLPKAAAKTASRWHKSKSAHAESICVQQTQGIPSAEEGRAESLRLAQTLSELLKGGGQ